MTKDIKVEGRMVVVTVKTCKLTAQKCKRPRCPMISPNETPCEHIEITSEKMKIFD